MGITASFSERESERLEGGILREKARSEKRRKKARTNDIFIFNRIIINYTWR